MVRSEKVYGADVTCGYSEARFITAKSSAAAQKKFENNDYEGAYPGQIEEVRSVDGVRLATPAELRDFPHLNKRKTDKRRI
jgi:hypothetical protein